MPSRQKNLIRYLALLTGAIVLAASVYAFIGYDYHVGDFQFESRLEWLPALGIGLHLAVDGISAPMVLLTGIVIFTGVIISWRLDRRSKDFFILLFTLVAGVFGVFESLDAFFLFFFYELAVIPMYLLIGVWGSSSVFPTFARTKEYSALKLTVYLVAGSVLIWVAIIAMYVESQANSLSILDLQQVEFSRSFQLLFFPFVAVGFGVLAGLWPFHTWSPDGHVAAPTAVSMLHAGVLMKLGAYGIIRLGILLMPEGARYWMPVLLVMATTNVVYGAISAMSQRDLKYVVGYSSVSHMGIVLMGFATLNVVGMNGAVLQMFSHGVMTALFFALVGVIYDQAHTREIWGFGGLARRMGTVTAFFTVVGLTSLGLPGLSGFVAEFLVFAGTFQTYPWAAALGVLGAAITAVYILRLLARVFFGPLNPQWEHLVDCNRKEAFAMSVLVGTIVLVGMWPGPFIDRISVSVAPLLSRIPLG